MTLDALGQVTPTPTPRDSAVLFRGAGFDPVPGQFLDQAMGSFLDGEEAATQRLMGFYAQARHEIEAFLKNAGPSGSDREFYGELSRQANDTLGRLQAGSTSWASDTFPQAYVAGAQLTDPEFMFRPVHDQALRSLSGYSLGLIVDTNEGIRRTIQQAIASGISTGITREELSSRLISSGLSPGPWKNVETRAGVIARTETMRAFNSGNVAGIRETGAVAVEWHAARDELTCPICAPLDGKAFILPDVSYNEAIEAGVPDAWARLEPIGTAGNVLKVPPRHPRCRCTVRARYRTDGGVILGAKAPVDAQILAEAQSGGAQPTDLEARIAELGTTDPTLAAQLAEQARVQAAYDAARNENVAATNELYRSGVTNAYGQPLGPAAYGWKGDPAIAALLKAQNPELYAKLVFASQKLEDLTAQLADMRKASRGDPDRIAFWRSIDMTQADLERIGGTTGRTRSTTMTNFMRYRYGVELDWKPGMTVPVTQGMARAFELVRTAYGPYAVDNPFIRELTTGRLGQGTIADYNKLYSRIRFSLTKMDRDYQGIGSLRSENAPGIDEVIVHEISHAIEDVVQRNGGRDATKGFYEIQSQRTASAIAPNQSPRELARVQRLVDDWQKSLEEARRNLAAETSDQMRRYHESSIGSYERTLARLRAELENLSKTTPDPNVGDYFPTEYAKRTRFTEDWAESVMLFMVNPEKLRRWSPARYDWIQENVFHGKEPPERWAY